MLNSPTGFEPVKKIVSISLFVIQFRIDDMAWVTEHFVRSRYKQGLLFLAASSLITLDPRTSWPQVRITVPSESIMLVSLTGHGSWACLLSLNYIVQAKIRLFSVSLGRPILHGECLA